jgi:adenine phosphoribosyltransferase
MSAEPSSVPPPHNPSESDKNLSHNTASSKPSTSSHPPVDHDHPDPTVQTSQDAQRRLSPTSTSSAAELANLKIRLRGALRQFENFPSPGILFEDIMPIFANPTLHEALVRALELHVLSTRGDQNKPDVIVGLEARGFLFGPSLALRLGASFVPVRKKGKLPGECVTASYKKEYGEDFFQMQQDGIKQGQKVVVVDDIIATGTQTTYPGFCMMLK